MLTAHRLSKSFGIDPILQDISFSINHGDRVGLIGPNGSGKTTLLRLLARLERPDSGTISTEPGLVTGYLSQGLEPEPALTVAGLINEAAGDPALLARDLAALAESLAATPDRPDVQRRYDQTLDRLVALDSGEVHAILNSLGLASVDPAQTVATLSGGQKARLSLALILLGRPRLLLLDEPTNHLDIGMLGWLEDWLRSFDGGALIVSHDRAFLDRVVTRIVELDPATRQLRAYRGNYSDYLDQSLAEREAHWSAWRDQEAEIGRIRRDIAQTKGHALHVELTTKPNQPTVRRLAKKVARKGKAREKKLERYLQSDERVEKPALSWHMKVDFDGAAHIGRDVLRLERLAVGYPGFPPLLRDLELAVQAGEHIALTGPNGSGKTTLLRTIAGQLEPLAGRLRLGGSVRLGYMSQEQEVLRPDATPLEVIQAVAPMNETESRSFLHYYLFEGDDALRPAAQLSYGERARLMLARLVAQGCTFLLLDEPVNHLDIPSRTQFEGALRDYPGTVLAVVHDRYFIERFATTVWRVDGDDVVVCLDPSSDATMPAKALEA